LRRPEQGDRKYVLSLALTLHGGPSEVYELAYSVPYTYSELQRTLDVLERSSAANSVAPPVVQRRLLCRSPQLRRVDVVVISEPALEWPADCTEQDFIAQLHANETSQSSSLAPRSRYGARCLFAAHFQSNPCNRNSIGPGKQCSKHALVQRAHSLKATAQHVLRLAKPLSHHLSPSASCPCPQSLAPNLLAPALDPSAAHAGQPR